MEMDVKPFDSFSLAYKVLTIVGFTKLRKIPKYPVLAYLFFVYRTITVTWTVLYCFQHVGFLLKIYDDKEKLIECLLIALPQLNMVAKLFAIIGYAGRLEKLRELMGDPIFAARTEGDKKLLRENQNFFNKFMKQIFISVGVTIVMWTVSSFIKRMNDSTYTIPIYVPFNTDTPNGFLLSAFFEHGPVLWIGVGHITSDCLIVCHYAQAVVQTKIIRQNLEHLTDSETTPEYYGSKENRKYRYIDDLDENIQERFKYYVRRYAKLLWFAKQVNVIFDTPISVQMFTTSAMLCVCIYQLSKGFDDFSNTTFYVCYFIIIQLQIFLYCFCGELVKYETQLVGDSVYLSDWYHLSPRFRKQLVIAMTRWTAPIALKASHVLPLSLTTFFTLMRLAFNLFAILKSTNSNNAYPTF